MWQGKKSFVLHAHTHIDIRCMDMYICMYIHMYVCMDVQQSGQKAKGENFLMVIDGDTSGVVRQVSNEKGDESLVCVCVCR